MAISKFPSEFSVEPIFTLTIDQYPKSLTTLPSPLPPGNYRLDTEYATDTIYLNFLTAGTDTTDTIVTLIANQNRSIFFSLSTTCDRALLVNSETAADSGAIVTVERLKRGLPTEGTNAMPYERYEIPDTGYIGWASGAIEIVGDKLYLIGGNVNQNESWSTTNTGNNGQIRSLDLTDLANPTWTTHVSASGSSFDGNVCPGSAVVGTDIYFQVPTSSGDACHFFKYDTVGASVQEFGAMPSYIDTSIAPLIVDNTGTYIYKYGNYNVGQTVGRFTVSSGTWTQLNNLPFNGRYAGYHNPHPTDADKMILRGINAQASFYYHNFGADTYTAGAALSASLDPLNDHQAKGALSPNGDYYIVPIDTFASTATNADQKIYNVLGIYPSDSITTSASLVVSADNHFDIGFVDDFLGNVGTNRIIFHSSGDMWVMFTGGVSAELATSVYRLPAAYVPSAWRV